MKKKCPANTTGMKKLSQQAESRISTAKYSLCIKFNHGSRILPNYVYIIEPNPPSPHHTPLKSFSSLPVATTYLLRFLGSVFLSLRNYNSLTYPNCAVRVQVNVFALYSNKTVLLNINKRCRFTENFSTRSRAHVKPGILLDNNYHVTLHSCCAVTSLRNV